MINNHKIFSNRFSMGALAVFVVLSLFRLTTGWWLAFLAPLFVFLSPCVMFIVGSLPDGKDRSVEKLFPFNLFMEKNGPIGEAYSSTSGKQSSGSPAQWTSSFQVWGRESILLVTVELIYLLCLIHRSLIVKKIQLVVLSSLYFPFYY